MPIQFDSICMLHVIKFGVMELMNIAGHLTVFIDKQVSHGCSRYSGEIYRTFFNPNRCGPLCGEFTRDRWSPHKGQWREAFMFSLISTWINGCVKNGEVGELRRHRAHYDVTIMNTWFVSSLHCWYVQFLSGLIRLVGRINKVTLGPFRLGGDIAWESSSPQNASQHL